MKWNGKTGLALLLIALGAIILLGKLGLHVGHLFGAIFPIIMIALGWYGIKHGRSTIGWIVLTIGLIGLIGALSGILAILIPVAIIWFGWLMLKNRSKVY
ncbi:LiaF transmembrane domain-containing protein [Paenibacillus thermotolerans]|uniref:LiaF transmembrane domain-containing protein n=1 Tax=Paenibacillus thermotolerans TaxID=3027807 RepID=UPI0023683A0F|nr:MULTISPECIES: hypothetical protein [unclassified Paenibacillus]